MNFIRFLPFEKYTLITKLPQSEVLGRLADKVDSERKMVKSFFNVKSDKPYEGKIEDDRFVISRIINYQNSFLPRISGKVETYLGETQIHIQMRLVTHVMIFSFVWLGGVGLVCIAILAAGVLRFSHIIHNGFSPEVLIPFPMLLFGLLLFNWGYKSEAKSSRKFLADLFEAKEMKN